MSNNMQSDLSYSCVHSARRSKKRKMANDENVDSSSTKDLSRGMCESMESNTISMDSLKQNLDTIDEGDESDVDSDCSDCEKEMKALIKKTSDPYRVTLYCSSTESDDDSSEKDKNHLHGLFGSFNISQTDSSTPTIFQEAVNVPSKDDPSKHENNTI